MTDCGRALDGRTLNSVLQNAKDSGAAAIRTWFFQSYYDMNNASGSWQQTKPTWTAFDRILNAAAAHHLMVIPVLVNEWPACEPTRVNKAMPFFRAGYLRPGYGYPLSFKQYATTVARHYMNNSTVAFWQLGNELESYTPGRCNERRSAHALRAFADDMTNAVKSADPHHLVSLGTIGYDQCGLVGNDYQYVHAGGIDLCDYHDYGVATQPIPDGINSLAERIGECMALDKPMFIGESGIPANANDAGQSTGKITGSSLDLRAGFFNAKMTQAFNAGLVGYVIWDKQQDASNSILNQYNGSYIVGPNDPTNRVTATLSRSFGWIPGSTRFDFEDGGVDGWSVAGNPKSLILSNTTAVSWSRDHSLVLNLGGTRSAIAATSSTGGAGGGRTIVYHVYVASFAPPGLEAAPYVVDHLGHRSPAPVMNLLPGWNVVRWTLTTGTATPRAIGLEIKDRPLWKGPVLLDAVSW